MVTKSPFEYRTQARVALQNRWGEAAIVGAIIMILTLCSSFPSTLESINTVFETEILNSIWWKLLITPLTTFLALLILPIQYAFAIALLHMVRGSEAGLLESTMQQTKTNYGRLFVAGIVITTITAVVGVFTLWIGAIILVIESRMM